MSFKKAIFFLLLVYSFSATAKENPDAGLTIVDIVIHRPLGLIATVAGTAFFVGISPLTAVAAISPPHDSFSRAAAILIVAPAKFTFDRPLGVFNQDSDGEYRR